MLSKISDFSILNKMPLLSGKMNGIMLSLINSQRYRNEMLATFTWIVNSVGSACSMVDKQTLWSTAPLFTKTSFFQTTKTPKIIFENSSWPNLAKVVLGKAVKDRGKKKRARHDKRVNYVWSRVSLKVVDSLLGPVRWRHHDCESGYFSMRMLILKKILTNHYLRRLK